MQLEELAVLVASLVESLVILVAVILLRAEEPLTEDQLIADTPPEDVNK